MTNDKGQAAAPEELLAAWAKGMEPEAYRAMLEQLVAEGRTTGADQGEEMVAYTRLNLARTVRNEKTVKPLPALVEWLSQGEAMHWLVLTEPWCGDSSQVLPVLHLVAQAVPTVRMRVLLRDEHPDLMDHYLTHGGRSIPKLIVSESKGHELFNWGPRPKAAQDMVWDNKALAPELQLPKEELYAKVHAWYSQNKGLAIQQELLALLQAQ